MPDAMTELLRQEMECERLLDCFHGLSELDQRVFRFLVTAGEPLTVDEVAARIDRERSTAYRSVKRLRAADLVTREQVNQEGGSYYHVFSARPPGEIADAMQRTLNDFYAKMGKLIGELRETYEEMDAGADDTTAGSDAADGHETRSTGSVPHD